MDRGRTTVPVRYGVGMGCTTCARPDVADINAALVAKADGFNQIARRFNIAKPSLARHRDNCLPNVAPTAEGDAAVETTPTTAPGVSVAINATQVPPEVCEGVKPTQVEPASDRAPTFKGKPGPGRPCLTCASSARAEIEEALLRGTPYLTVSNAIDGAPSHDAIRNHATNCIPDKLKRAAAEGNNVQALKIAGDLHGLRDAAMGLLEKATGLVSKLAADGGGFAGGGGDDGADPAMANMMLLRGAADVANKAKGILELCGKFSGEIRNVVEIDIRKAAQWPRFTASVAEAVADCDRCSRRVEAALESIDGPEGACGE